MLPASRYGSSLSGFSEAALSSAAYACRGAVGQILAARWTCSWLNQGASSEASATKTSTAPAGITKSGERQVGRGRAGGVGLGPPGAIEAGGPTTTRRGASAQASPSSAKAGPARPANSQNQSTL